VACRTTSAKRELVRIVRTPDGRVVSDPTGRLPGRGAYLCADGSCWGRALQRGALSRALGVPLPAALRDELAARAGTMMTTNEGGTQRGEE
jgi:predicted RNA-binding protein YlxR (DUF448 family)